MLPQSNRRCLSTRIAWLVVVFALAAPACTRPTTDIVATVTEDVGDFQLTRTELNANAFAGRLCVADPRHSDEIVARVIQQLTYQQFTRITLDVYSATRPVARYVRSGGEARREELQPAPNPCADLSSK